MYRHLLVILLGLICFCLRSSIAHAQRLGWSTAGHVGFVFQISNSEAQKLLTKPHSDSIFYRFMHTQIDTFRVAHGWTRRPERGHFIIARIVENEMHCEYLGILPYQVFLFNEYDHLTLQVVDRDGVVRDDAKVKSRHTRVPFDRNSFVYRISGQDFFGQRQYVSVELDGFRSFFEVRKREKPYWAPSYYANEGPTFYSYMLTDKNRYKPGEKVRFKSYALSRLRMPLQKQLDVWLVGQEKPVHMGQVSPHRPGSYAGEFVLHDSLRIQLDKNYGLELRDGRSRIVANTRFLYQDYELNGDRLEATLSDAQQFYPASNVLTIRATDVNGLPIGGARVRIIVRAQRVSEIFQQVLYVPDTLMNVERDLVHGSDTRVEIPSALFEKANVAYSVEVTLTGNTGQQLTRTANAVFQYTQYAIDVQLKHDSVLYTALHNGLPMRGTVAQLFYNNGTAARSVVLPYQEKINTTVSTVDITSALVSRKVDMERLLPRIEIVGGFEKDTFKVALINPHEINVSWFIYHGSELLDKGYGTQIDHRSMIKERSSNYYVELVYSFANKERIRQRTYQFNDKALSVQMDLPDRVYPGQSMEAVISVTDQTGAPVGGVDLTAIAVNSKLDYYPPDLTDYGTRSAPREEPIRFDKRGVDTKKGILLLDYNRWARRAGLDTMKYYQLLYPAKGMFIYQTPIKDSTQFAIYVMRKGKSAESFVIEVNRHPVHYSWTTTPKRYSFYVAPDRLTEVSIRLIDRVLVFDSLCFSNGYKTIISVDVDNLPAHVTRQNIQLASTKRRQRPAYPRFTVTEKTRYSKYLAGFRNIEWNAYLMSGSQFIPIGPAQGRDQNVAGPIPSGQQTFANNGNSFNYRFKGGYTYAFEDGVVYREPATGLIPERLVEHFGRPSTTIDDIALTKNEFLSYRDEKKAPWITRSIEIAERGRRLSVALPEDANQVGVYSVLFEHPQTGHLTSACPLWEYLNELYILPEGRFHLIILYNDGSFFKINDVLFSPRANVYVDFNQSVRNAASELSADWRRASLGNCLSQTPARVITLKSPPLYQSNGGNVQGIIYDDTGLPMPGANVVIKGTTIGTVSDAEGYFSLDIMYGNAEIVVSFIGYVTTEMELQAGTRVAVQLMPDIQQLSEVVVVGYGVATRRELTGAISPLQGRVAGVQFEQLDESNLTPVKDTEVEAAERQLYQELLTLSGIRSNFADVAIWEPRLFTDRKGRATFQVNFPDDITQWNAAVFAMNRRLQTGVSRSSIRSYKPIMAQLDVPRFMVAGDSAHVHGNLSNFSTDSEVNGSYQWEAPGISYDSAINVGRFAQRLLPVVASGEDSIRTKFVFRRDDGYTDGEVRKIPLIQQGTTRAHGSLSMLAAGQRLEIIAGTAERTSVEVVGGSIDIWAAEARHLIDYRYACNEQLASKLLGLIAHRNIMAYQEQEFSYDYYVKDIIRRLLKNQNTEFLWSWWDVSSNTSYWVSAHILRALKAAKDAGYRVDLDVNNIARKTTYKFEMLGAFNYHDADLLQALAVWGANIDYEKYLTRIDTLIEKKELEFAKKNYARYSLLRERLLLTEVRQLTGLPYDRTLFARHKKLGLKGEVYFSDRWEGYEWYSDDLTVNTIAYRIARRDSSLHDIVLPMQQYFLSRRAAGQWNTYHAASVLLSVLPDFLAGGATKANPIRLVTTTSKADRDTARRIGTTVFNRLPIKIELQPDQQIALSMEAGLPTFVMQYKTEIVTHAMASSDALKISTVLGDGSNTLLTGSVTKMTVDVTVTSDARAEYVMIEIPIPAGCSYTENKGPVWNETHREYFKDRVNIYFERMSVGTHRFELELLPRFSGVYHVNPAQVSLMYFPVVNANTSMSTVQIKEE